jgi:tRNA-2-methylthio-N6-dimethylallyladenosine synthase
MPESEKHTVKPTKGLKYTVCTFGCQMNVADSNEMSAHLERKGFSPTPELEEADLVLVNTCTVRQQAENRALSLLGRLKEWKRLKTGRVVVLTGCAAERIKDEVSWRIPQVDLTVGAKDIDKFGEKLEEFLLERFDYNAETRESFNASTNHSPSPAISYVTIMRGCNYTCSYCIVPAVRGREVYRPLETILEEVQAGVAGGSKEVLLLGQTVNSYSYENHNFASLLAAVDAVPDLKRIRFMSPHPHYFDAPTIEAMAGLTHVCEHVHLPVQSGSNKMLKEMKRNYTRERYLDAATALRKNIPGVAITTDFIVGFPGETEEDFEATLNMVEEGDFSSAYCFKYSPRPGTHAATLADNVPTALKEERLSRLLEKTGAQADRNAKKLVGTLQEILIEEFDADGAAMGRTRGSWKVKVKGQAGHKIKAGELVAAVITSADGRSVEGEARPA